MRKFLSMFFLAALLLIFTSIPAYATGISISVDAPPVVKPGQIFDVNLNLTDPTECNGVEFYLQYDATKVQPIDQGGSYFLKTRELSKALLVDISLDNPLAVGAGMMEPISWMGTRSIGKIQFQAIGDGVTEFKFVKTEFVNAARQEENLPSSNGSVAIDGYGPHILFVKPTKKCINEVQPEFKIKVQDYYSSVNPSAFLFSMDGQPQGTTSFIDGILTVNLANPLASGSHVASLDAYDTLGNKATEQFVFTIDTEGPTISLAELATITRAANIRVEGTPGDAVRILVNGQDALLTGDYWKANVELQNGLNTITIIAYDEAGNETVITRQVTKVVTVDMTVNTPDGYRTANSIVTLTGTVDEGCTVRANGQAATVSGGQWTIDLPLVAGNNTLNIQAADDFGNVSPVTTIIVVLDQQGPLVTLLDPQDGSTTNQTTITLSGSIVDGKELTVNGLPVQFLGNAWSAQVTLQEGRNEIAIAATDDLGNITNQTYVVICDSQITNFAITNDKFITNSAEFVLMGTVENGALVRVNGVLANMSGDAWSKVVSLVANQPNEITVVAIDTAGNQSTKTVTVTHDSTAPVVTITSPEADGFTNKAKVLVTGTIDEQAEVLVNGQKATVTDGTWNIEVALVANQENTITVVATDVVGNTSEAKSITITSDTVAPELSITSPEANHITNRTTVTLTGQVEGGAIVKVAGTAVVVDGSFWTCQVAVPANGTKVIEVTAIDLAGNETKKTITVINDSIAPVVAIVSPEADSFTKADKVVVSGTIDDNQAEVMVNGQTVEVIDGTWSLEIVLEANKANIITVVATDAVGNTSEPKTITINHDTVAPTLTLGQTEYLTNKPTVTVNVTTEGAKEVLIDGKAAIFNGTTWSCEVATNANASKTIEVVAVDEAGNETKDSVTVINDSIAPAVTIDPIESVITKANEVNVSGTIDDNQAEVKVNGQKATVTDGAWNIEVALVANQANIITVVATDAVGNSSEPRTITITNDSEVNNFTVNTPPTQTSSTTLNLTGTVEYGSELSKVWIVKTAGGVTETVYAIVDTPTVGHLSYSAWNKDVSLAVGQNQFIVFAQDALGNTKKIEFIVTRNSGGGSRDSSPGGGTIVLPPVAKPNQSFLDLPGHWAQQTVERLAYLDVIDGYPDGNFYPNKQLSRLEAATLLGKALGLKPGSEQELKFVDNQDIPQWAKGWVAVAVHEGIVKGYGQADGSSIFKGDKPVSRVELAAMIARVLEKRIGNITPASLKFADIDAIPTWAIKDLGIALNQQVVAGYPDNTFRANQSVTRAEAATMVLRMLEKL